MDKSEPYRQAAINYRTFLKIRYSGAIAFFGVMGFLLKTWSESQQPLERYLYSIILLLSSIIFVFISKRWQNISDEQLCSAKELEEIYLDESVKKYLPFQKRSLSSSENRCKKINYILGLFGLVFSVILLVISFLYQLIHIGNLIFA